jgi:serine/threonine-protein kinase
MDTATHPRPGAAHGPQYELRRLLGEGGYGEVYEAWDHTLQRSVAIKRLKALPAAGGPDSLLGEARAAASLSHTAFVKIYALGQLEHAEAIIMELVPGRPLAQLAPLAAAAALDVIAQVAEAMREAHGANLIHGDLKPSNLMLEPAGRVRILDFGLASRIDPLATQSLSGAELQGTIAYLAPERLAGGPPSVAGDVYALGVVLYHLLTGERPHAGLHGLALAAAQLHTTSAQWSYPEGLAPALTALVRAMTAAPAAHRLRSMAEVGSAIGAIGDGRAPRASRRWWPGRRWRRRAAALAAVAALLAGAAWLAPAAWVVAPFYSGSAAMHAGLDALRHADRDGSLDIAIGRFNAILQQQPRHAGAAAGLSLAYSLRYFGDGRDEVWLQRASAAAQQALAADSQLALAHAAQAWVLESERGGEAALAAARQALRLDPLNLFALWGRADLLINLRRDAEAAAAIAAARAAYPRERIFLDLGGRLSFQQGRYREAEQAFRASIALDPDSVYAYANLHAALLRQNRSDEGLQALQQGLQVRPNSRLYTALGNALFYRGDYLGAHANFALAVSSGRGSPNHYLHWANLADALRWLPGRADQARDAYLQALLLLQPRLDRERGNATLLSRMGLYHAKLSHRAQAADYTRRALAIAPDGVDTNFRAALAYEIGGDRGAALAQLRRAKALGYPAHLIDTEPDLLALRRDLRYHNPESTP